MQKDCGVLISVQTVRQVMADYATGFRTRKTPVEIEARYRQLIEAALSKYWEKRK